MTEKELKQYLQTHYPKETTSCEWKEFKSLKHFVKGHEGEDIISYVSAIANRKGGHLAEMGRIKGITFLSIDIALNINSL